MFTPSIMQIQEIWEVIFFFGVQFILNHFIEIACLFLRICLINKVLDI